LRNKVSSSFRLYSHTKQLVGSQLAPQSTIPILPITNNYSRSVRR